MRVIDMHCDTLMEAYFKRGKQADIYDFPEAMVDFRRMKQGEIMAQFFAIFVLPQSGYREWFQADPVSDEEYIEACAGIFYHSIEAHADLIAQAKNGDDVIRNLAQGKMSAVLTMEDGAAVRGKLENLKYFYDLGVRALSLTWNFENCFGFPNSKDPAVMERGLTPFGKEAVAYMQELGMLVDVSHLSDGGFYDVAAICKKPFVATHSNCRSICPHQRNLTDDMIRILGEHGGAAGINFGPEFLNHDITDRHSSVIQMVSMAKHMKQIGGIDVVAIGTDFDGIGGNLDIKNSGEIPRLADALSLAGFTSGEVEQVLGGNVLRVMREAMK